MENPRGQLVERLQTANNILVTVSANPSVDQLAAAIGLTLMLNKLDKQATVVFSGKVPSTIEFLQPEKTIEKNTDSLRDFIIALDKSKADKLRYKVEDNHVKIFITPYKTALSEKDLKFSQGDFNIEVVVALGVKDQSDLDRAITAHGRILHDATTISVTNGEISSLGSIDWDDPQASSLSEMAASLVGELGQGSLDGQVATAFMTGIVAQTERFRNARTSPATMSIASTLMAAGANQQLIASKLEHESAPRKESVKPQKTKEQTAAASENDAVVPADDPSALHIDHEEELPTSETPQVDQGEPAIETVEQVEKSLIEDVKAGGDGASEPSPASSVTSRGSLVLEPPTLGGKLTANTEPEHLDPSIDPLGSKDAPAPLLEHRDAPKDTVTSVDVPPVTTDLPEPITEPQPVEAPVQPVEPAVQIEDSVPLAPAEPTLKDLEAAVHQSYDAPVEPAASPEPAVPENINLPAEVGNENDLSGARDAVSDALASIGATQQPLPPIAALNAQPLDINDQLGDQQPVGPAAPQEEYFKLPTEPEDIAPQAPAADFSLPENLVPPAQPPVDATAAPADPSAPPAVPPPFMPNMPGLDGGLPPLPPQPGADNQQQPASSNNPFNLPPA